MDRKAAFFARTMHTPDSPERAELRAALRETSKTLIVLHRHLIDAAKAEYAAAFGPVASPAEMLQLLTDDPYFAWLKPVTSLIVDIDGMTRTDFELADAYAIGQRLEHLFGPGADDANFSKHYIPLLQNEVDVTIGHAALRSVMAKLRRP
jgi:hypothetical protein